MRLAASNERDLLLHGGPKWRAVMHSQTPDRPSIMSVHVERMRASTSPHHLNQGEPLEVADAGDEAIGYATSSMHGGVEAARVGAKATTRIVRAAHRRHQSRVAYSHPRARWSRRCRFVARRRGMPERPN